MKSAITQKITAGYAAILLSTITSIIANPQTLNQPPIQPTAYETQKVHPQRFLVAPKPTFCPKTLAQTLPEGAKITELLHIPRVAILSTNSSKSYHATLKTLQECEQFDSVEPDILVQISSPNDTAFEDGTLWGLKNTGQQEGTPTIDIQIEDAWKLTKGEGAIVAVIDTGVLPEHQDLAGNLWVNPNETLHGKDTDGNGVIDDIHGMNAIYTYGPNELYKGNIRDDNGHGTHVAGTIAAIEGGGPLIGVAPKSKIMVLKFLDETGVGWSSDAATCLNYAIAHGAHLTNNSWGWEGNPSTALRNAINTSIEKNIPFVAAAGNSGKNLQEQPFYPASYPNVISVSAINRNGEIPAWSNTNGTIAAPGASIYSATHLSPTSYNKWNGTSMAAPHVSGILALLQSYKPNLSYNQKLQSLLLPIKPLPTLSGNTTHGGIPQAWNTLTHTHYIPPNPPPAQPIGAPTLTTPSKKQLLAGRPMTMAISATNNPTQFSASRLPQGLQLNPFSGIISGIPKQKNQTLKSQLRAQNNAGIGTKAIEFVLKKSSQNSKKSGKKQNKVKGRYRSWKIAQR